MVDDLVSIILRTKDRPELVKEALMSIQNQTYRPIQVCVVNDGGRPLNAEEIKENLQDIELDYTRHDQTLGRAKALNTGVSMCKGGFIGILDDDDLYYPNALEILVGASKERGDIPVYGKVKCRKFGVNGIAEEAEEEIIGEPFDLGRLVFHNFIATNSLLVPKTWMEKIGLFDEEFEIFEDWEWLIRLGSTCEPGFVNSIVGEYRIFRDATITGKGGEQKHLYYKELILKRHMHRVAPRDFLRHVQDSVDKVVLEKEAIINRLNDRIKDLSQQLEARDTWLAERDNRIKELEGAIFDRDESIRELEGHIKRLEDQLSAIFQSLSWKVTKPLRFIKKKTIK